MKGNFHARFLGGRGRVNRLRLPGTKLWTMGLLRILGGVLSLVVAAAVAWPAVALFRPVVLPLLSGREAEQTHFYVLTIAGLSVSGWQNIALEALLVTVALALIVLAVYAFTVNEHEV